MQNAGDQVVEQLVVTGKWSRQQALAGVRADFRCEFCGLDLLACVENSKLWQLERLVPKRLKEEKGEDPNDIENLAIACKPCNFDFKHKFDPGGVAGPSPTRAELIKAAIDCINEKKKQCAGDLPIVRAIAGRSPLISGQNE